LPLLRQATDPAQCLLQGNVARRMYDVVAPFAAGCFITPMAAVAGSVAEEILAAMTENTQLARAYVNNGGDIALHLVGGEHFTVGLTDRPDASGLLRTMIIDAEDPTRGVATSGRHGRSCGSSAQELGKRGRNRHFGHESRTFPLGETGLRRYTGPSPAGYGAGDPEEARNRVREHSSGRRAKPFPSPREREPVKQAEEASFIDLIACERDCRTCSYAAALDCDGNCGVCPHNGYCPCVNPVVARSKTALRIIELRPILLQDVQGRG